MSEKPRFRDHLTRFERAYFEEGIGYEGYEVVDADYRARKLIEIMDLELGSRVLDVGCAYGHIVKALRDRGIEAVGVDVSAWAGTKDVSGWYVRASAHALPFRDGAFGCVYSQGTLEHIPEPLVADVISEFRRVAPKGYLGVTPTQVEVTELSPPGGSCQFLDGETPCEAGASHQAYHTVGPTSLLCKEHQQVVHALLDLSERDRTHTCMHTIQWWLRQDLPPTFLLIEKPPHEVEDVYGMANALPFEGGTG